MSINALSLMQVCLLGRHWPCSNHMEYTLLSSCRAMEKFDPKAMSMVHSREDIPFLHVQRISDKKYVGTGELTQVKSIFFLRDSNLVCNYYPVPG